MASSSYATLTTMAPAASTAFDPADIPLPPSTIMSSPALSTLHAAASASSPDLPMLASSPLHSAGMGPSSPLNSLAAAAAAQYPSTHMNLAKRLSTSSSSELSQRTRATSSSSGRTRVGSNPALSRTVSTSATTTVSTTTASSSSRPSSVASNSSRSSTERSTNPNVLLSPTLLSPALASTLAAGRSAVHAGPSSSKRPSVTTAPGTSAATGRRISLPNVPSMMNRVSMVSVASFESLPENEALGVQLQTSPTLSDSSSSVMSPRSDLRRFPALPPSPRLRSSLSISESPPTSPDLPRTAVMLPNVPKAGRPKASLKRATTEPYGAGKEFETLMSKRRFVAMELLETERAYMQSLKLLDENFLKPMQAASIGQPPPKKTSAPCPQLSRKVIAEIFGNFTNIFTLNKELLSQLEQRLGQQPHQVKEQSTSRLIINRVERPSSVASGDSVGSNGSSGAGSGIAMSASSSSSIAQFLATTPASVEGGEEDKSLSGASQPTSATTTTPSSQLTRGWSAKEDLIGDILVPIAPFLSMYKLFAQHFSNSLARIEAERKRDEGFAKFVKAAERAAWVGGPGQVGFGLGFEAHLLTIVQRITRYKMLVGDLVKFTPEGHPDRSDLVKAFSLVSQIAHDCDDNIKQHEMVLLMLNIQRSLTGLTEPLIVPGRSLLKRGALLKSCRRNIQPREIFLFSDCIVYASPTSGGMESSASAAWQAMVGSSLASVLGTDWSGAAGGVSLGGSPLLAGVGRRVAGPSSAAGSATPPAPSGFGGRVRTSSGSVYENETLPSTGGIIAAVSLQAQSLQFRAKFSLQDCTVVSVDTALLGSSTSSSSVPEGLRHSFELHTPEKSFALYAESRESKEDWMTRIREAKEAHMIARRTLRAEEDSIEAKRERRRSLYKDPKSIAAMSSAGPGRSALRFPMAMGGSSPNIATVREDQPFPDAGEEMGSSGSLAVIEGRASVDGAYGPSASLSSSSLPLPIVRERQRLRSLQSITAAIPTPSLGNLLSPTIGTPPAAKPLKVVEDYNAPVWVPDSHADKCAVCSEGFGIWRRRHHCRLCGQVVCWNCSQRSFLIPAYEDGADDQQARACDRCFDSMFPPSEDEASPETTALRLPGLQDGDDGGAAGADEEEDEEEGEGGDSRGEADLTARAVAAASRRSTPVLPSSSTPLFRPRLISVQADHDASLVSPTTAIPPATSSLQPSALSIPG
ncbi:hypothetical protein V8E36_002159 [Tilletia maclaganii]